MRLTPLPPLLILHYLHAFRNKVRLSFHPVSVGCLGVGFRLTAAHVAFLLEVYLFAGIVNNSILQICKTLIGNHLATTSEAATPLHIDGKHPLLYVGFHKRMHIEREFLNHQMLREIFKLVLKLVGEKKRRLHCALSETRGAGLRGDYVESGTHSLPCDLH